MFNKFVRKIKQERAKKVRGKIFLFSFMSSVLTAIAAVFLSQKENREIISKKANQAASKIKEESSKISKVVQEKGHEVSEKVNENFNEAKATGTNFFNRFKKDASNVKNEVEDKTKEAGNKAREIKEIVERDDN